MASSFQVLGFFSCVMIVWTLAYLFLAEELGPSDDSPSVTTLMTPTIGLLLIGLQLSCSWPPYLCSFLWLFLGHSLWFLIGKFSVRLLLLLRSWPQQSFFWTSSPFALALGQSFSSVLNGWVRLSFPWVDALLDIMAVVLMIIVKFAPIPLECTLFHLLGRSC